jgi:hypothetical protein
LSLVGRRRPTATGRFAALPAIFLGLVSWAITPLEN